MDEQFSSIMKHNKQFIRGEFDTTDISYGSYEKLSICSMSRLDYLSKRVKKENRYIH